MARSNDPSRDVNGEVYLEGLPPLHDEHERRIEYLAWPRYVLSSLLWEYCAFFPGR